MSRKDDELDALLERVGARAEVAEAVRRVDAVMQKLRRGFTKRELGKKALTALSLEIDLPQLDILFAIAALNNEFEPETERKETMVSTVAERLNIDPSRASRLVSEMVERGFVVRKASQRDSRRTILDLTEQGEAIVRAVLAYKWLLLSDHLSSWNARDLELFVPRFEAFSQWIGLSEASEKRFADEIAELARNLKGE